MIIQIDFDVPKECFPTVANEWARVAAPRFLCNPSDTEGGTQQYRQFSQCTLAQPGSF